MINSSHLPSQHKIFYDYTILLVRRWLLTHIASPCTERIHVLFDHPVRIQQSPKDVERARRDKSASDLHSLFSIDFPIENSTLIPYGGQNFWRKFITNRKYKGELVKYPSHSFLGIFPNYLKGRQKYATAGGFDHPDMRNKAFMCYSTNDNFLPIEVPSLKSDHVETDSRASLHALHGSLINILIFSRDTDTCHNGRPLL